MKQTLGEWGRRSELLCIAPSFKNSSPPTMPTPDVQREPTRAGFARRNWGKLAVATLVLAPALLFTIWAGLTLSYTYSSGERSGYVQKLSRKGWVCKTWEGELAMANLPGAMPQIFLFSVRRDSVAEAINRAMAKGGRVVLTYREHRGVPTNCFGETDHYVDGVQVTAVP